VTFKALLLSVAMLSPEQIREDESLLARIMYHEARGEGYSGMIAVGIVIKNRVMSDRFPNTIREVIKQPHQFEPVSRGLLNHKPVEHDAWDMARQAAKDVLQSDSVEMMDGALFFHSTSISPSWDMQQLSHVTDINEHRFYAYK